MMTLTSTQIGQLVAQFFLAGAGTLSFAVLFACPKRTLPCCALVGAVGWFVYELAVLYGADAAAASLIAVIPLSLAARIHAEVPADESPEMTEGYEGFYHLASMKGTVDRADMHYIIRDFDRKQFEARKRKMMEIAKKVGKGLHPDCYIELVIEDSYYNMREKVVEHPHILDIAQQAMRDCDIEPELKPIRGGTDGAQLSFMGLPCPNLFTGGYNYHGKHEFVTLEGMEKAVQVIVRIAELTAQRK